MGKITILNIPSIIFQKSIGTYCWAKRLISVGVINGAKSVAMVVSVTDKARFALAMNDITLDASPLGEEPTNMIPAAISGGKPKEEAIEMPMIGIMVNWQIRPIMTPFGILMTPAKSLTLICDPIPNIMICKSGTINLLNSKSPAFKKYCGKYMDMVTAANIQTVYEKLLSFLNPLKLSASKMKNKVRNGPVPKEEPEIIISKKRIRHINAPASKTL